MWGAIAQAGMGAVDQILGFVSAKKAYKRTRKIFQNRYQWAAQDLEKAGLNRILALTKGPGMATAMPMAKVGGMAEATRGGQRIGLEKGLLEAQTRMTDAQTALSQSSAVQVNQQTLKTHTENELLKTGLPAAQAQERFDRTPAGEKLRMYNRGIRAFLGRDKTSAK